MKVIAISSGNRSIFPQFNRIANGKMPPLDRNAEWRFQRGNRRAFHWSDDLEQIPSGIEA
jgi:hypothetical protein